ncbi:hypothetical protein NE237_027917 [Protea cynaroides]|uniref:Uncharacterized protein n=1 Tax=Protea cynaroides TaxID=273540 RepID=A0A9Q0GRE3_9MAGN|nr:hypothetical protein NE237_027917 [Protea cynaroides]
MVPSTVSSFIPRVGHPPHCVTARPLGAPRSTTPLPTHAISPSIAPPQPGISFDSRLQPPSPTAPATMTAHRDQNQESMGINSSPMPADLPSDNAIVSSSPPASTRKKYRKLKKGNSQLRAQTGFKFYLFQGFFVKDSILESVFVLLVTVILWMAPT